MRYNFRKILSRRGIQLTTNECVQHRIPNLLKVFHHVSVLMTDANKLPAVKYFGCLSYTDIYCFPRKHHHLIPSLFIYLEKNSISFWILNVLFWGKNDSLGTEGLAPGWPVTGLCKAFNYTSQVWVSAFSLQQNRNMLSIITCYTCVNLAVYPDWRWILLRSS